MVKKIKDWMHWRGVTIKDLVYGIFALGTLCAMAGLLVYLIITSTLA
jgi:hypothetical protein